MVIDEARGLAYNEARAQSAKGGFTMSQAASRSRGGFSMTEGSLWKSIFVFSIPLMLSQVLQVLFNMADVAVVGKFASASALGSVGSTTTLVTLFTGFLIGMGSGVNVIIAQRLGARDDRGVMETVHTSLLVCTLSGLLIAMLCLLLAPGMLALLNTKPDLMDGAVLYFRIYALGMPALGIFNFGNAVLSANGDTRRPLVYLTIAGVLNVALNLFFVIVCGMAADGVALASIISQYLSAILVVLHLARLKDSCALHLRKLRFYPGRAGKLIALGVPAGLQNAIFAVANLFIQAGVNSFDSLMVAGNAAAANADSLIYNVMAAFYTACSTFMGQNWGAGRRDRMMKSYFVSTAYSFAAGAVLGILLVIFGETFLSFFTNEPAVADAGMQRIRIMGYSYAFSAFMDCTIAASRGIGKSFGPTVIVVLGSCVFRVAWVYTIFAHFHTIPSLYLLYVFSWSLTAAAEIAFFAASWKRMGLNVSVENRAAA